MLITFPAENELSAFQHQIRHEDLIAGTHASLDYVLGLIGQVPDGFVTFQPVDPQANDTYAADAGDANLAWTLGHVIVHLAASGEEAACLGSIMARGIPVDFRARYEVPWQTVTRTRQLVATLEESQRIRLAYLAAWPDAPHLDVLFHGFDHITGGPLNAVGRTLLGLKHDADHYGQIAEIIRQAQAELGA